MYCHHCGEQLIESDIYCPYCGKKVVYPSSRTIQDNNSIHKTSPSSFALNNDYTGTYHTHNKKIKRKNGKKITIRLVILLSILVIISCLVSIIIPFFEKENSTSNNKNSTNSSGYMDCLSFSKSPTGRTFKMGIDEYTSAYNQACQSNSSAGVSALTVDYFDYSNNSSEEEVYYVHKYYNSDNNVATIEIGVETSTKRIIEISYTVNVDNVWKSGETTKNIYVKELPIIIYTSLGIPEKTFFNSIYLDALNNGGKEKYLDGVNYCITADSDEILLNICASSYSNYISTVNQSPVTEKDEEAKKCASYQIRKQVITKRDFDVYNLKIVDISIQNNIYVCLRCISASETIKKISNLEKKFLKIQKICVIILLGAKIMLKEVF